VKRLAVDQDYRILWGPASLVPQPRDLTEMAQHFRWFVGAGERPTFDRYTYWEKFDYWAVFWGMAIIGGSGLLLWFPELFARIVPGWVFNIALLVHGEEALLAVGFIFTIHFFNGHLRPEKFPMDMVIFTGTVTEAELRHERPGEFERLMREGRLEAEIAAPPSRRAWTIGRIVGTTAVTLGLAVVVLIVYALLSE
jgi:cytochrome b subunit of formate dehydrogenase